MNWERLNALTINAEGFAFDGRTGNTYNINSTGLLVVNQIKAGATNGQIIDELTARFEVDRQTAALDLEIFLNQLEREKFVEAEVLS